MLQAISDIVKNVAIIILLSTFLDMLLPNNNMQRFIKVVIGLFVMVAILNPVIGLLDNDLELSAWQLSLPREDKVDTVLAQGKKLSNLTENQALEEYKQRIEKQIESLVKLVPEVGEVKCGVQVEPLNKIGSIGNITKTTIWVSLSVNHEISSSVTTVEPVKIEIGDKKQDTVNNEVAKNEQIKEKIISVISNYYGLEKNMIDVVFY